MMSLGYNVDKVTLMFEAYVPEYMSAYAELSIPKETGGKIVDVDVLVEVDVDVVEIDVDVEVVDVDVEVLVLVEVDVEVTCVCAVVFEMVGLLYRY